MFAPLKRPSLYVVGAIPSLYSVQQVFAFRGPTAPNLTGSDESAMNFAAHVTILKGLLTRFQTLALELPSIGWQLFILGSSQSDSIAFPSFLDTYATRLLAEALSLRFKHGNAGSGR